MAPLAVMQFGAPAVPPATGKGTQVCVQCGLVEHLKHSLFGLSQPKSKCFTPPEVLKFFVHNSKIQLRPRRAPRAFATFRLATIYLPHFLLLKCLIRETTSEKSPKNPIRHLHVPFNVKISGWTLSQYLYLFLVGSSETSPIIDCRGKR